MKIWYGYGSDHSANLVMVGEFKSVEEAYAALELLRDLTERARVDVEVGDIDSWSKPSEFSDKTKDRLRELNLYNYSPSDISDFAIVDPHIEHTGSTLTIRTDEVDIGAFVKLLVDKGAKVQVYCADLYPDDEPAEGDNRKDA